MKEPEYYRSKESGDMVIAQRQDSEGKPGFMVQERLHGVDKNLRILWDYREFKANHYPTDSKGVII